MKEPKENVLIITINPLDSISHSRVNRDSPHGRVVMDQSSLEDSDSTKTLTPGNNNKKTSKIRLWLQTEAVKIRKSRTRQALIVFSFIVLAVLLAVLIWLETSGHLHDVLKKTTPLQLKQGTYLGEVVPKNSKYARSVEAYRGIPYAQSTAGENRFRPPQPLNGTVNRNDVQRAISFGHVCPQSGGGKNQGEDCLNVNIFRPHFGDDADAAAAEIAKLGVDSKKMPIVIYVHGGGFNSGSGAERNMLSFVAWSETPLIGMSFNYRVGALGFLPGAVAAKAGLVNLGLKDQQALFRWVQDNAADFGGDPKNVTIMGQSAGAHSVGHHLISYSPANKLTSTPPPFQKAILESGAPTARAVFVPTHPLHEQQLQEFLVGCGLNDTSDDKLFDELRSLPLNTVVTASNTVWRRWDPSLRWAFQPVIDGPGGIIPDLPIKSWEKGNVLRIPILTGYNTNEGTIFVPSRASNSSAMRNLMSGLIPALNKTDLDTLNTMYPDPDTTVGQKLYVTEPPAGFGTQFWRLDDVYSHYAYICPVLQTAHLGSTAKDAGPIYVYHYAARSNSHGGADHGDETPVVTHDMDVIGKYPGIVAMADGMNGFWSRFVVTGNPNTRPGSESSTSTANNTASISWPKFVSPFNSSTSTITEKEADNMGKVTLFGEGNDERMGVRGRQNKGVAAQIGNLTQRTRNECTFWWGRVILSEGFGNGSTSLGVEQHTKARL